MVDKSTRRFKQMSAMVSSSVLSSWNHQIDDWDKLKSKKKHTKNSPYPFQMRLLTGAGVGLGPGAGPGEGVYIHMAHVITVF